MQHRELREEVCRINREIVRAGLVVLTFGNASGVDRATGVMAIKPSGVDYGSLTPEDIVVVALEDGRVVAGTKRPSSDTPTHRHLYLHFSEIGGIVHTHSIHATAWAQAQRAIPCFGTTHADHVYGTVPVTRPLRAREIRDDYEWNTGAVIVERFRREKLDPLQVPAVLVAGHAPFVWGRTPAHALENAIALEAMAQMAMLTLQLRPRAKPIPQSLLDKHFLRKHGPQAYYGQP
ncbi:MAG: L-ribulose-5-phosphate 4-epimerase AraD [Verrucomicrobiae bacterium]|nr:L-ribulose-5-phosphate 4-epimerase AraD [Verrucomicrobiae bacterium]